METTDCVTRINLQYAPNGLNIYFGIISRIFTTVVASNMYSLCEYFYVPIYTDVRQIPIGSRNGSVTHE